MRNVVTLSNIPPDVHEWLKVEAKRQSGLAGQRVGLYQVILQAVDRYRAELDIVNQVSMTAPSAGSPKIPEMEKANHA